jgi:hypothetical protein
MATTSTEQTRPALPGRPFSQDLPQVPQTGIGSEVALTSESGSQIFVIDGSELEPESNREPEQPASGSAEYESAPGGQMPTASGDVPAVAAGGLQDSPQRSADQPTSHRGPPGRLLARVPPPLRDDQFPREIPSKGFPPVATANNMAASSGSSTVVNSINSAQAGRPSVPQMTYGGTDGIVENRDVNGAQGKKCWPCWRICWRGCIQDCTCCEETH